MDRETETLIGEDAEMAMLEVQPPKKNLKRRPVALAAVAAAAVLVVAAVSMAGHKSGMTSQVDSLVMKDEDGGKGDCDTAACSDDEFPNLCAGRLRVKCCTKGGDEKKACCLKEGKTNPDIYTAAECSDFCDSDTPCKDADDKDKEYCKAVEKVRCCERKSNLTACCASAPKVVKHRAYCNFKCNVGKACQKQTGKNFTTCEAKETANCQKNKTCTVNIPGKGVSCAKTGCCQDPNMACYEKNLKWAECRQNCQPGNQTDDNAAFPGPWSCRIIGGCSADWSGCLQSRCCRNGFKCYTKNPHWAQCRKEGSCTAGVHPEDPPIHQTPWACKVIDASTTNLTWTGLGLQNPADAEDAGCAAAWAGCLGHKCCKSPPGKNFSCYAKNPHWAQCRETNNCQKGIHNEDPVEHRTPWACQAINKSTGELTWEGLNLTKPEEKKNASDAKDGKKASAKSSKTADKDDKEDQDHPDEG